MLGEENLLGFPNPRRVASLAFTPCAAAIST